MKFLVRYTSEHTLLVEAGDAEQALRKAESAAADDWDKTSGQFEIDDWPASITSSAGDNETLT
jgi:hypothetical protein